MKKNHVRKILVATSVGLAAISLINCSKSSDGTTGGASSLSEFATLLAEEMVLASPTAQKTASGLGLYQSTTVNGEVIVFNGPSPEEDGAKKKDRLEELLKDEAPATCNIVLNLHSPGNAPCYGPSVNYTNHESNNSSSFWPGGDLGIWEDTNTGGEACVAAQLNGRMKGVMSLVDAGQFIGAGIGCVANKEGITLPSSPSTSVDMTAEMAGVITLDGQPLTVSSALIARDADSGSNPVFITTLAGTAGTKTINIRIKHIPTASDDSTNRGKISVKVSNTSPNSTDGVSLEYEKATSTQGKFLLKRINFNTAGQDPFISGANQTVDFAKSWNGNGEYFIGSMNLADYTGQFSYAWQAGNGDSHTRVFNTAVTASSAIGYFGFGPRVQVGAGSIEGMICAWTGPDQSHVPVTKVQKQTMVLTLNKFVVSGTQNTVFDPVADCEASGAMSMNWNSGASTRLVSATTENLSPLADVATGFGTLPTAPTAVD